MTTVAELPKGYRDIPEEDQAKARTFFEKGDQLVKQGGYDYAIEMYLQGLNYDPENVEAHQTLREVSLKRKASGGKDLGMMQKMKVKTNSSDEKQNMLAAEKLLAFDPGNLEPLLRGTMIDNRAGVLAQRDTLLQGVVLTPELVDKLMDYMHALTDDAARDLTPVTPARVPSGLRVDRPVVVARTGGR